MNKEPTCRMQPEERRQLYDEIMAGTVLLEALSLSQLGDFRCDFDEDYDPSEKFFLMIGQERHRRMQVKRKPKAINRDFF